MRQRKEKDGAQDLTITYACARMRYGRGRCVIGTLSVVDRARVLLPLIRKKCHDALLWQLKWNFTSRGCDVWCVITTAGESCNETRCGSRVRRPRPVAFTGEDRTQAS